MRCSLVRPLSRFWILWTLCPAIVLAVPVRPVLENEALEPSKVTAHDPGTPIIAVDTIWIADWSFDLPGGGCFKASCRRRPLAGENPQAKRAVSHS